MYVASNFERMVGQALGLGELATEDRAERASAPQTPTKVGKLIAFTEIAEPF